MEKVSHIVISKKDNKDLKKFLRMCELAGLDISAVNDLIDANKRLSLENKELRDEILDLQEDFKKAKQELKDEIKRELNQIAINVHNEAVKTSQSIDQNMKTYLFKGSRINEQY